MALRMLIRNLSTVIVTGSRRVCIPSSCSRCAYITRNYFAVNSRQNTGMGDLRRQTTHSSIIKHREITLSCSVMSNQCWKCHSGITTDTEFCLNCKSLQPLNKQKDYFGVLGIQKNFSIDVKALTKRFKMLQAQFHPDKYTLKSEREQQFAHDHSSIVNKAYRCILHPVNRAVYLLDLAGQPLHEGQLDVDTEFLMAVMEMNEDLAEAKDKDTLQAVSQRNMAVLDSLLSEADAAFSSNDISKARVVVAKIKYYNSIYEKVKAIEREHGIIE